MKKSHANEDLAGSHTVIGVLHEALKEEKAREDETETEVVRRREIRKSLNRRVSFASHATIRYKHPQFSLVGLELIVRLFPQAGTPTATPSPRKGVGFHFDGGTPSTDNDSTGTLTPPPRLDIPRPRVDSPLASDSEETSMDIADDNLTLPLPSALVKRAPMQRGVGFLIDDGDEDLDMDVTQPLGGIIAGGDGVVPSMDGVNRFLSGEEDDQTMEFTRLYSPKPLVEDDTVGMDFTKVVGKIQVLSAPAVDKENLPPNENEGNDGPNRFGGDLTRVVTMDMTRAFGTILPSQNQQPSQDGIQEMAMTQPLLALLTPRQQPSTPESSPFYNSPIRAPTRDAEIIRSPLSTGLSGTPQRTPSRGLLAIDLLTGKSPHRLAPPRRKSDSGIFLGSPRAAKRMSGRKSIAGVEEFTATRAERRVSLGRASWTAKEFGSGFVRSAQESGLRDMISKLTPRKPTSTGIFGASTPVRTPAKRELEELMLTPGMMKREFGPKVANLVRVWEDGTAEEDDFEPITLAEFLAMTNISFLDGLGPSLRRRTVVPPEGMLSLREAGMGDYVKAGAVSIPMLELYQFVPISRPKPPPFFALSVGFGG